MDPMSDQEEAVGLIVGDHAVVDESMLGEDYAIPDWLAEHDAYTDGPDAR